jgi:hypothetical protein
VPEVEMHEGDVRANTMWMGEWRKRIVKSENKQNNRTERKNGNGKEEKLVTIRDDCDALWSLF